MTSLRQIEANRRNARLSTGPVTEEGKKRSRRNAVCHGLTAETVIDALEDSVEYAAFELAITADYEPQSAVERELVLRLASLLWRLRRATAIESGLFKHQARHQRQFHTASDGLRQSQNMLGATAPAGSDGAGANPNGGVEGDFDCLAPAENGTEWVEGLTQSFVQLANLPTRPLDRLSRYEATLWRQAGQIILTLRLLQRRGSWKRMMFGPKY
jgi:hypothetical protein